jgi:hypothetical protein
LSAFAIKGSKNNSSMSRPSAGSSGYLISMERRLAFLGFLVTRSEIELSYVSVEQLWTCCASPGSSLDEHEIFYGWLCRMIPNPCDYFQRGHGDRANAVSSATAEQLFSALIHPRRTKFSSSGIQLNIESVGGNGFLNDYFDLQTELIDDYRSLSVHRETLRLCQVSNQN